MQITCKTNALWTCLFLLLSVIVKLSVTTGAKEEEKEDLLVFKRTNANSRHHHKRCRYSEHEIAELNEKNLRRHSYYNTNEKNNDRNEANELLSESKFMQPSSFHRQPKVRDQFNTRYNDPTYSMEHQHQTTEKEIIFVNTGEKVNLTCHINTKEIDWHFKDKNQTTTILSFGLQLQVAQPLLYDLAGGGANGGDNQIFDDLSDTENESEDFYNNLHRPVSRTKLFKYQLSSDRQTTHVLTLYVQGTQDEGSYQCVDSKSDVPVKKTILVYLKNNSRALASGYSNENRFDSIFYLITFVSIILNSSSS